MHYSNIGGREYSNQQWFKVMVHFCMPHLIQIRQFCHTNLTQCLATLMYESAYNLKSVSYTFVHCVLQQSLLNLQDIYQGRVFEQAMLSRQSLSSGYSAVFAESWQPSLSGVTFTRSHAVISYCSFPKHSRTLWVLHLACLCAQSHSNAHS